MNMPLHGVEISVLPHAVLRRKALFIVAALMTHFATLTGLFT